MASAALLVLLCLNCLEGDEVSTVGARLLLCLGEATSACSTKELAAEAWSFSLSLANGLSLIDNKSS